MAQAHFFYRRHPLADQFRLFHFERIWYSKSQAALGRFSHGIDNYLGGVSQNRRPPTTDVIDVFIPVDIPNLRPFRTLNEKSVCAHMTKCTHWGVYAAWDTFQRGTKQLCRTKGQRDKTSNVQRRTSNAELHTFDTLRCRVSLSPAQWRGSQDGRSGSAKPLFAGSIPAPASSNSFTGIYGHINALALSQGRR